MSDSFPSVSRLIPIRSPLLATSQFVARPFPKINNQSIIHSFVHHPHLPFFTSSYFLLIHSRQLPSAVCLHTLVLSLPAIHIRSCICSCLLRETATRAALIHRSAFQSPFVTIRNQPPRLSRVSLYNCVFIFQLLIFSSTKSLGS